MSSNQTMIATSPRSLSINSGSSSSSSSSRSNTNTNSNRATSHGGKKKRRLNSTQRANLDLKLLVDDTNQHAVPLTLTDEHTWVKNLYQKPAAGHLGVHSAKSADSSPAFMSSPFFSSDNNQKKAVMVLPFGGALLQLKQNEFSYDVMDNQTKHFASKKFFCEEHASNQDLGSPSAQVENIDDEEQSSEACNWKKKRRHVDGVETQIRSNQWKETNQIHQPEKIVRGKASTSNQEEDACEDFWKMYVRRPESV